MEVQVEEVKEGLFKQVHTATLHHGLGLGWVFFGLGQNGLGLGWVWVGFNPVKLLKIHYEDLKSKERKKYY